MATLAGLQYSRGEAVVANPNAPFAVSAPFSKLSFTFGGGCKIFSARAKTNGGLKS